MKNTYVLLFCLLTISSYSQTFSEIAKSIGIEHSYNVDNFGGGISFYDFDKDGWDDLSFATPSGDEIYFYKNNQGVFQRVFFNISDTSEQKQLIWADLNNNGHKDLLVCSFGASNKVYLNNGSFVFTEQILSEYDNSIPSKTFTANVGDIDNDGDLDIFLGNRSFTDSIPNQLFLNDGTGVFTDVTTSFFFDSIYYPTFCTAFLDYNNDGMADIYTAEDRYFGQNQLYQNIGSGQFTDETNTSGTGVWIDAMGLSIADYNQDGLLDIYVSNGPSGNPLFYNNGDGTFKDTANYAGISFNAIAWSNHFFDYDNDGYLDLHVCATGGSNAPGKNGLYQSLGNGTFQNTTTDILDFDSTISFASAIGDYNNDGFPEIAVNNVFPDSAQLWENSSSSNNWVKINLEGTQSNTEGLGSWIKLYANGLTQSHYVQAGTGFQGQNSQNILFGIGGANLVDSLIIQWPSGQTDHFYSLSANQLFSFIEGQSVNLHEFAENSFSVYPNPFENIITLSVPLNESYSIQLFTSQGKLIHERANIREINTENLSPGVYYLHIKSKKKLYSFKLIKN
jgi:hypothetical protein